MNDNYEAIVKELFELAGITINGSNPFDIQVNDKRVFGRIIRDRELGLGESYMDGWWECEALDEFFYKILKANLHDKVKENWQALLLGLRAKLFNRQSRSRAFSVGQMHYDIGNDLYQAMLDKRMNYTCGYWHNCANLDAAQEAKLELVCRKINLTAGMSVLDLGCGWGCFARYAAEKHGANVVGVTVSREQVELGTEMCKGLPVKLLLKDYRDVDGMYDRVISIGIMEHVGYKNYRTYMETVDRCLKPDGMTFIHTIGANKSTTTSNPWNDRYIFRNGMLPSVAQISKAMEGLFFIEDLHNIGPHYDKTLMAWWHNFNNAWPELKKHYDDRFYRMWRFYLLSSAGAFRARYNQLWQIVMSRTGQQQPECRFS